MTIEEVMEAEGAFEGILRIPREVFEANVRNKDFANTILLVKLVPWETDPRYVHLNIYTVDEQVETKRPVLRGFVKEVLEHTGTYLQQVEWKPLDTVYTLTA